MRISVAMCTYNGQSYLWEQLQSIAEQTVKPYELVVCDDGSTDSTILTLERFAEIAPFQVRIIKNPVNLGYAKNFEKAISLCGGDLIALSDQDDVWYLHKLQVLCSILENNRSIGGVFSDADLMGSGPGPTKGTLWGKYRFTLRQQRRFRNGRALEVLLQRSVVTGMTLVFRAELRDKLLPIPPSWEHDGWLAFILVLTSKLEFTPEALGKYRIHEAQQIGVPESQLRKLKQVFYGEGPATRARSLMEYTKTAQKIDDLAQRLADADWNIDSRQLTMIRGKADHSRMGLYIQSISRPKRLGVVLRSLEGYRRYSARLCSSMIKDLVAR